MNYFATFFTHSGAIKFTRFLTKKNIFNESSPVPRKLSSNCGIGVSFNYKGNVEDIFIDDMERLYSITDNNYSLYIDFDED
ncbi:MAG: DUF3343 domain-containing protein [Peptostreptococcaceae bacterium]